MTIKNSYDCEQCLNKKICKYYDDCKSNANRDIFVKSYGKGKDLPENLSLTVTCNHYKTECGLTYPPGVKSLEGNVTKEYDHPYLTGSNPNSNANITISNTSIHENTKQYVPVKFAETYGEYNGSESSKNMGAIITERKHI